MENKEAIRISILSIVINAALSIIKMIAGIVSNSTAMVSDSIHSASDIVSTIIVIVGISMASKEPDDEHPYGHERIECVAGIILSVILMLVGLYLGFSGLRPFITGDYTELKEPGILALISAIISIAVKEIMYRCTANIAKKINSTALMADAHHHRSDALSSIGAMIGIIGSRLGYLKLDSIASMVICVMITKAGYDIFKESIYKLIDTACEPITLTKMKDCIMNTAGVRNIDGIKTRLFGSMIYIDLEIAVDGNISLYEAHKIAENVHDNIESDFRRVKHCMVHVNPYTEQGELYE